MAKSYKLIFIILVSFLSSCLTTNALCNHLSKQQEKQLLEKIHMGISKKTDQNMANKLAATIRAKNLTSMDLYNLIILTPPNSINAYIIYKSMMTFPKLYNKLLMLATQKYAGIGKTDKDKITNTLVHFILAAKNAGDYNMALQAYEIALYNNYVNSYTFSLAIPIARMAGDYNMALQAYSEALKRGLFNNNTFSNHIATIGTIYNLNTAQQKYQMAIEAYNAAITVYNLALETNLLNSYTFSNFIIMAEIAGDLKMTFLAFNEALKRNIVNTKTFLYFIFAAKKAGDLDKAIWACQEALKRNLMNDEIRDFYIDTLVANNRINEAIESFLKLYPKSKYLFTFGKGKAFDLRKLGFGQTYILTHLLISKLKPGTKINIITGIINYQNENRARRAVELFVQQTNGAITISENQNNLGTLTLTLVREYNHNTITNARFLYRSVTASNQSHWEIISTTTPPLLNPILDTPTTDETIQNPNETLSDFFQTNNNNKDIELLITKYQC